MCSYNQTKILLYKYLRIMTSQLYYICVIIVTAGVLLNGNNIAVCSSVATTKTFTKYGGYHAVSGTVLRRTTVTVDADCGSLCTAERACNAFRVETRMVNATRRCELVATDDEAVAVMRPAAAWTTYTGKLHINR